MVTWPFPAPASWPAVARRIANRNFSRDEWTESFGPDVPYRRTFIDLPDEERVVEALKRRSRKSEVRPSLAIWSCKAAVSGPTRRHGGFSLSRTASGTVLQVQTRSPIDSRSSLRSALVRRGPFCNNQLPNGDGSRLGWRPGDIRHVCGRFRLTLVAGLKAGDDADIQRLWDRYFHRLVALAGARLARP